MQGRAGLLFPLGQTPLYTACLLLFYKSTKTAAPLRLRWHTRGNVSVLSTVVGTGLQGDGTEQKVCALWGLFTFEFNLPSPSVGFTMLLSFYNISDLCSLLAGIGVSVLLQVFLYQCICSKILSSVEVFAQFSLMLTTSVHFKQCRKVALYGSYLTWLNVSLVASTQGLDIVRN